MGFRKLILGREARRNIGLVAIETPVGRHRDAGWLLSRYWVAQSGRLTIAASQEGENSY